MEIKTWDILEAFEYSTSGKDIFFKEVALAKPEGLEEEIKNNWDKQLESKNAEMRGKGINTEIRPYHLDTSPSPFKAIYEGDKPKMWPGPVISLVDIQEKSI